MLVKQNRNQTLAACSWAARVVWTESLACILTDSRMGVYSNHCVTGIVEPDMLTGLTERDWLIALEAFDAVQSCPGGAWA